MADQASNKLSTWQRLDAVRCKCIARVDPFAEELPTAFVMFPRSLMQLLPRGIAHSFSLFSFPVSPDPWRLGCDVSCLAMEVPDLTSSVRRLGSSLEQLSLPQYDSVVSLHRIVQTELQQLEDRMKRQPGSQCLLANIGEFLVLSLELMNQLARRLVHTHALEFASQVVDGMDHATQFSEMQELEYINAKHRYLKSALVS